MPSVDETTPLWEQGAVNNTNHLGEHQQDENDDNDNHTTPLLRHNTVELGPPADPYRISYWIMVIQGASMLLPWNGVYPSLQVREAWRKGHCSFGSLLLTLFLFATRSVHHGTGILQVEVYRIALRGQLSELLLHRVYGDESVGRWKFHSDSEAGNKP